ncbi:DNA-binding protein [Streptomyces sp. CBMA152]|uniref:DNA-binding protein n=1 Tax=Streptomyces sp. CBMA152 TaxID=1896312 RepID=UPI001CB6BC4A|nr:DNA-binding protein [Streptomyces sp. CBMA152]
MTVRSAAASRARPRPATASKARPRPATAPDADPGTLIPLALGTVQRLVSIDAECGATAAVPAVREALRSIPHLTSDPTRLRGRESDLLAALAELCEVIGWILFDAGFYGRAHHMNARALALAELCGDRGMSRLVLLNDSMLDTHTGRPRRALETASRVAGPRPLPARVSSLVLVRQAHASALLGGRREAVDLISRAQSRFLDGVSADDPHWAWWIDEIELLGHRGWVHARLREWDTAVPLLYEAATAPGPSYRHLFTAELLAALVDSGAWSEAEDLITDIAPRAGAIGSVRTTQTLASTAAQLLGCADAPTNLRDAAAFLLKCVPGSP